MHELLISLFLCSVFRLTVLISDIFNVMSCCAVLFQAFWITGDFLFEMCHGKIHFNFVYWDSTCSSHYKILHWCTAMQKTTTTKKVLQTLYILESCFDIQNKLYTFKKLQCNLYFMCFINCTTQLLFYLLSPEKNLS